MINFILFFELIIRLGYVLFQLYQNLQALL